MAISEQMRLFVGNLPPDIQDGDLAQEFKYYGAVERVEIKHKKQPDSEQIQNTFAFVTISLDDRKLKQCLQEFKEQKFQGRFLQVTVARENFLEKLKREREEAAQQSSKKLANQSKKQSDDNETKVELPTIKANVSSDSDSSSEDSSSEDEKPATKTNGVKSKKIASSDSSDSDSDSDQDPENLILKKKSKIFLENGKIKIDRNVSAGEAIHVIDSKTNKKNKKQLGETSMKADQKRMESMKKMKNAYNEQKLAIKNALAVVDSSKKNNKIVFDNDDDDDAGSSLPMPKKLTQESSKSNQTSETVTKPNLFNDDEDSDQEDFSGNFEIKEQFQGKKGEKLMKLQSRFQGDNRFKMDSKFLDDSDNEDGDDEGNQKKTKVKVAESNPETAEDDERQWQFNILEKVMGKRVQSNITKKKAPPSMLRFDPTRAEHTKFVEPKSKKRKKNKDNNEPDSKRAKITENHYEDDEQQQMDDKIPVSMEHFHEIRGDLKKSMGGGGFSLLSMFNRPSDNEQNKETKTLGDQLYEEKPIAKNTVKFLAELDPFKYDSSGDEADDGKSKTKTSTELGSHDSEKNLKNETFFILNPDDGRLSEGMLLFTRPEKATEEENADAYDDAQRQELKNIVKRKIKKSIQNALPKHAKPNKRFRRFAKNL